MITLDLDLAYLSSRYHIDSKNLQRYQNMSIVQIMKTEAEQGNQAAAGFLQQITNNPKELAKVLMLYDPKNRFLILAHMNQKDLMGIMEFLTPKEMILGLSMFNHDGLIMLMQKLPPETLSKVVLSKMDLKKFLKSIPEKFMDEFLKSDKLDTKMMMKAMENVDEMQLQKMMENYTGQPCYEDRDSIIKKMGKMDEQNFMRCVSSAEIEGKQQLIMNMIKEKPELFEEFSAEAMTHPFQMMEKEDILKSLTVLETQEMLPMVEDLPQDIMALIATQIDPEVFSEILCKDFASVIATCGMKLG